MKLSWTLAISLLAGLVTVAEAAQGPSSAAPADELSAKAFLEELMVRRYNQGLATLVEKQAFSVGVQLEMMDIPPKPKLPEKTPEKAPEVVPPDLLIGTLDPEKLIPQFAQAEETAQLTGLLAKKRIKAVMVSVGLREDLGQETKDTVDKWLTNRLKNEFGPIAKHEVTYVKMIPEKPEKKPEVPPKDWLDWLNQFQHLAGEAVLAFALLLGIILWRFTTSKTSLNANNIGEGGQMKLTADGKIMSGGGAEDDSATRKTQLSFEEQEENRRAIESIAGLATKLTALVPRLNNDFAKIVSSWSQAGDEGFLKLACFAESVGREVGRLPIPPEAMKDAGKMFAKMAEISPKTKAATLEKVYWDLVSVLNLGPEVLSQPFSYLGGVDPTLVGKVLMAQNPKMKTLVSLFLPDDVRRKFVTGLETSEKIQLLENASQMSEIPAEELQTANESLRGQFGGNTNKSTVPLEMSLEKVIGALSILEEISLLRQLKGPAITHYKRTRASLCFLEDWPDAKLSLVVSRMPSDQLVTYLRIKPEMKDRILGLAPPLTAEVVGDELNQPDRQNAEEKVQSLEAARDLLQDMVKAKEVDLTDIFPLGPTLVTDGNKESQIA